MNIWNVQNELNGLIFLTIIFLPLILSAPALVAIAISYFEGTLKD
jgi:hypothetical protein